MNDWEKYLNVLKRAESEIVTVTIRKNEVDDKDEDVAEYLETLDNQDKKDYQTALTVIKKNNTDLKEYENSISFF